MELIIVRHGETQENVKQISQGHQPGKLTNQGRRQARRVGQRLKNKKIDFIYSSDLKRTKDTLQEILKFHDSPVIYTQLLRERGKGIFEGRPTAEYAEAREKSGQSKLEFRAPGGENYYDLLLRIKKFWKMIKKNHKADETVLICSHGMTISTLFTFLCGDFEKELFDHRFFNTSVTIIDVGKKSTVKLYNCIKHLQ